MPFYTFENEKGEEFTLEMSISERDEYVKANPNHKQLILNMNMVHDVGGIKVDNGWKSMLNRIKKNNRGSTINTNNFNLGEI